MVEEQKSIFTDVQTISLKGLLFAFDDIWDDLHLIRQDFHYACIKLYVSDSKN